MSLRINLLTATPYTFTRENRTKLGLKVEENFVWLTTTISRLGEIEMCCSPEKNPKDVHPIYKGTTKEDLEERGLYGFSLQMVIDVWINNDLLPNKPCQEKE